MSSSSAHQRVHLVTGANKGLGFEAVRQLATQDPQALVLLGARDVQRGEQAVAELKLPNVKFLPLDCTSESSVAQAVQTVTSEYKRLDWLINNAGIAVKSAQDTFDVNYYGAKRVMEAFLPLLRSTPGAKVILVSSEVGAWCHNDQRPELQAVLDQPEKLSVSDVDALAADYLQFIKETQDSPQSAPTTKYTWVNSPFTQWYGISKTLASVYARVLAHQLKADRIPVIIVCPGYCATDINQNSGFRPVHLGGASIVEATTHSLEETGNFYQDGQLKPAKHAMPELYVKLLAPKPKVPEDQAEGTREQQ